MAQGAKILSFSKAYPHAAFLGGLKGIVEHSSHSHEQAAYALITDLEEQADSRVISLSEFDMVIGKAADILMYFRFDLEGLAAENSWYRASVIHQMCCGMLQVLRLIRPDLNDNVCAETAYQLYRYRLPLEEIPALAMTQQRPIKAKQW